MKIMTVRVLFISHLVKTTSTPLTYQIQLANLARGLQLYNFIDAYYAIPQDSVYDFMIQSRLGNDRIIPLTIAKLSQLRFIVPREYYAMNLIKIVNDINPDVIVTMEDNTLTTLSVVLMKKRGLIDSKIVIYHGPYKYVSVGFNITLPDRFFKSIIGRALYSEYVDLIIARTTAAKKFLIRIYRSNQIIKIPPAIDTELFRPYNCSKNKEILFVGRLSTEKGIDIFVKVVKILLKNYRDLYVRVVTTTKSRIITLLKQLFKDRIYIDIDRKFYEMPKIYSRAFLTLNTSREEIFGMTMAESLACGTPVIATPTAGSMEIIINKFNGIIVNSFNEKDIFHEINYLLQNSDLYNYLRKNSRKSIIERFSIQKVSRSWALTLKQLIE